MVRGKLKMELIANEKLRCRTFQNRQKGLRKKLLELSILCDVDACMIVYRPNGNDTYSCRPDVWPENHYEVQRIVNKYINERKEDHGKRTVDLSHILESRKRKAEVTKGQTSESGLELDGLSYEKLTEIIDKLDKKLEPVKSLIGLKKKEAGLMSETPVNSSQILGLPTAEPAFQGTDMVLDLDDLDFPDPSSGVIESDSKWMVMNMGNTGNPEFGGGKASSSDLLHHSTQFQDPVHCDPAHGVLKNSTDPSSTSYQKMGSVATKQEMSVSENPMMMFNTDPTNTMPMMSNTGPANSMPQKGLSEHMMMLDMDRSISMQQIQAYRQHLLGHLFFHP